MRAAGAASSRPATDTAAALGARCTVHTACAGRTHGARMAHAGLALALPSPYHPCNAGHYRVSTIQAAPFHANLERVTGCGAPGGGGRGRRRSTHKRALALRITTGLSGLGRHSTQRTHSLRAHTHTITHTSTHARKRTRLARVPWRSGFGRVRLEESPRSPWAAPKRCWPLPLQKKGETETGRGRAG